MPYGSIEITWFLACQEPECLCYESHQIIQLSKFDLLMSHACQKTTNSFLFKNIAFVFTPPTCSGVIWHKVSCFSFCCVASLHFFCTFRSLLVTKLQVGYCQHIREGWRVLGIDLLSIVKAHILVGSKFPPFQLPLLVLNTSQDLACSV